VRGDVTGSVTLIERLPHRSHTNLNRDRWRVKASSRLVMAAPTSARDHDGKTAQNAGLPMEVLGGRTYRRPDPPDPSGSSLDIRAVKNVHVPLIGHRRKRGGRKHKSCQRD